MEPLVSSLAKALRRFRIRFADFMLTRYVAFNQGLGSCGVKRELCLIPFKISSPSSSVIIEEIFGKPNGSRHSMSTL